MVEQQEAVRRRAAGRSPSYPGIGLADALDKAEQIYQHERRHPAPIGTIVGHWGFRSESGPALVAIAALKKFGLLVDEGSGKARRARLSDDAYRILTDEREDSGERSALLQEAALRPPIHRELYELYGRELPSDASLKHKLLHDYHFTESGAREFIRQFRETLEFTDLIGPARVEEPKGDKSGQGGQGAMPAKHPGAVIEPPSIGPKDPAARDDLPTEVRIPISLGQWVTVQASSPLSEAAWDRFLSGLEFMKPGLVAPDPPAPAPIPVAAPPAAPATIPDQAPRDPASRPFLTYEAEELLLKVDEGGVPAYMTGNLKRIAEENGVAVAPDASPNDVIEALRRKARAGDGE